MIVPAYKAQDFITESIEKYHNHFSKEFFPLNIIVVCNGGKDNTYKKTLSIKEKFNLTVINTPKRGKGHAVMLGLKEAKDDIVGFLDADDPYSLKEVSKMINLLNNSDMVIATKFKTFSKYQTSLTRRIFSICGAIVFRFLFKFHFKDTQAGAKFMKKDLLEKFKKEFVCTGFEFDMELLYEASKAGAKIEEYYIKPNEADFSTVKMRILPGIVFRLLKMRLFK